MCEVNRLKDVNDLSQNHHHSWRNATLHIHDHEDETIAFSGNGYEFFFSPHIVSLDDHSEKIPCAIF